MGLRSLEIFYSAEIDFSRQNLTSVDRDSNLVPPGYKPQSIRMSHTNEPWLSEAFHTPSCIRVITQKPDVALMLY